jgi:endonuclease/exonuclease/phosphatase family metal-dependent hydrolase
MTSRNSLALGIVLITVSAAGCKDDDGGLVGPGMPISVFTHNLYLGSDISPLALLTSPDTLPDATATLWANVQASNFPERAKVLAAQIVAAAPDLVALQEVTLYRRQVPSDHQPGDGTANATDVVLDFLATLMGEIDAQGGGYHLVGESPNVDAEVPVNDGAGGLFDLRLTDRDVILARDTIATSNFVAAHFNNKAAFSAGGASGVPIALTRGFCRADVVAGDARFTFANSHLEIQSIPLVQPMQAAELVAALAGTPDPVLLLGDFNSPPGKSSYQMLAGSYRDAFDQGGTGSGFTCCQADDLRNPGSNANERIDLVLYRGRFRVNDVTVLGTDPDTGRTPGGLWPSDHFGVLGHLELVP